MPHLVATALTGAALALSPVLAPVAPAAADPVPATELRLTLTYPGATTSGTRTVTLTCGPAGGKHPKAAEACAELARSGGRFEHAHGDGFCTLEYAPVIAEAEGRWAGRPVRFRREYSNGCVMRAYTGTIFAF
ncbi:SSI family serine proteinase inhibitor [Actinomadura hibisca]|uniref:SSI family serine proteinase inhibitor n=1 Tax=Actinomadura hibisca TaxID=68565 RepID=UPI0008310D04|nr:SSI family serine proteinase inhibitor [Actinomadura hibisca]